MFGFGPFCDAPFAAVFSGEVVIEVFGALEAQYAEISADADVLISVIGSLQAQDCEIGGEVETPIAEADGTLLASAAGIAGYVRRNMLGVFNLEGNAEVEFVGTTSFIDMVEQGDAELGIVAEIRLRSL